MTEAVTQPQETARGRRTSRREREERRERAWQMRVVHKLGLQQIADALGWDRKTITRDLRYMRQQSRQVIQSIQGSTWATIDAALEVLTELEAVQRQAWADLMAAGEGAPIRARLLRLILACIEQRIRIMQSLGLLEKTPTEVLIGDLDVRQLTDEEIETASGRLQQIIRDARAERVAPSGGDQGGAQDVDGSEPDHPG